jgi:hypothetical protein
VKTRKREIGFLIGSLFVAIVLALPAMLFGESDFGTVSGVNGSGSW